jgi:SIR2-like domain
MRFAHGFVAKGKAPSWRRGEATAMDGSAEGIPYVEIKKRFAKGTIVPFLGAGASLGSKPQFPLGGKLALALARQCGLEGLLKGDNNLDETAKETIKRDLARVASYYRDISAGERALIEFLEEIFQEKAEPGIVHSFLAETAKTRPILIMTTNYDRLIETAFDQKQVPYYLVIHPVSQPDDGPTLGEQLIVKRPGSSKSHLEDPRRMATEIDFEATSVIYKIHGSYLDEEDFRGHYLISEENYIEVLARPDYMLPSCFQSPLRKSHFLFMGYSLADWNFRVMMYNLNNFVYKNKVRHWAIQHKPSRMEERIWDKRSVSVFDIDVDTFISELRATNA